MTNDKKIEKKEKSDWFKIVGGIVSVIYAFNIGWLSIMFLVLPLLGTEGPYDLTYYAITLFLPVLGISYVLSLWYAWYKNMKKTLIVLFLLPPLLAGSFYVWLIALYLAS